MDTIEHIDEKGRHYRAYRDGDMTVILGPPEGLVDHLGLPEPFATSLHNILFRRGLMSYEAVSRNPNNLIGAIQEAVSIDAQRLTEAFFNFQKEEVPING